MMKKFLSLMMALLMVFGTVSFAENVEDKAADDPYTLEQVVILSRHNLRAPLSSNGSVPSELTPHSWIQWSANSSELILKGGFCAHDVTVLGTLTALGAKLDALPDSIETKTPIGVKLMFERLRDQEGQAWYRVSLVYRSTEQIRSAEMLTLDNPPMKYTLSFEGAETNGDGLIAEADLFSLFDRSVSVLDELETAYALEDAA